MPKAPQPPRSEMAKAIRNRRRELELTQAEVGTACGMSAGTVSNWEAGQEVVAKCLIPLAQVLQCDLIALLNGEIKPIVEGSVDGDTSQAHAMKLLSAPDSRDAELERLKTVVDKLSKENEELISLVSQLKIRWRSVESVVMELGSVLDKALR